MENQPQIPGIEEAIRRAREETKRKMGQEALFVLEVEEDK